MLLSEDPDEPFTFRATSNGRVSVSWRGRQVTVLRGKAAARFLARAEALEGPALQLEMAKVTGNFKRGNERRAKSRERGKQR